MTVHRIAQRFFLAGSESDTAAACSGSGGRGLAPPTRSSHPFGADTTRSVSPQLGTARIASLALSGSPLALHHSAAPTTWIRDFVRIGIDSAVATHVPCRRMSGTSPG
ncbi:MAG: hypothetical protein LC126_01685 [Bryobacterales bacterium]|nr:hypothetical protein [Bryobacterales bacterium]